MKKKSSNIFKKGKWCPLFGVLPRFEDEPSNSIKKQLIAIIYSGRELWGITKPDLYQELCPRESKLKWTWGISPQQIKDARLIYLTFMQGCMYSTSADFDPSQTKLWYLESRMAGIAGVKSKFKGIHLYALLAICHASSALANILHRNEDENSRFVLNALSEAQVLMARANNILMSPIIDRDIKYSQKQREKQNIKAEKEKLRNQKRNEYLKREAKALKQRHPEWSNESIKIRLAKDLSKNPDYKKNSIGPKMIGNIIRHVL